MEVQNWNYKLDINDSTKFDFLYLDFRSDYGDIKNIVSKNNFKTLDSHNAAMFTQLGILRQQEDSIEEIFIDDVMATETLAELQQYTLPPSTQQCTL